jgi:2-polyprenyl-3-methyl-5-hydroxy-6-metoxy-1,4-benzoquinol methylase
MYASIDDLRSHLRETSKPVSPEYAAKMLHAVPDAEVVDRAKFILERCKGQVVLDVGASGPMHEAIVNVAAKVYGIDRQDGDGVVGIDLDDYHAALPVFSDVTRIVCGEVLEHLSNPGWFLKRLREAYRCETIITVPNAFAEAGRGQLKRGTEVVNIDHVSWLSYTTLRTLLQRHGYEIKNFWWYNGQPYTAEGLIVVTE